MKIAIVGYGRMGHKVEEMALKRGHKVVCIIDAGDEQKFESAEFKSADVAIEFTTPATAVDNILHCFAAGVPVVCGTTGWMQYLPEMQDLCSQGKGTLLYASNFSIGVNLFRAINRFTAELMNKFPQYLPTLTEIHHIHKLDHPSGTAISLAEDIIGRDDEVTDWVEAPEGDFEPLKKHLLPVSSVREGEVPGIHTVRWFSPCDEITLRHEAFSRDGFAEGAVEAAEWVKSLKGKKGLFTMSEMLSDITGTRGIFTN